MKTLNGNNFYTIGEVGTLIDRGAQTIKHWYKWYEKQNNEVKELRPLPKMYTNLDAKGTRYFKEDEVQLLEKFRDEINYGQMSEYNRSLWGKRGQRIKRQKVNNL